MNILMTGATGFVGGHLIPYLQKHGHLCRAALRSENSNCAADESVVVGDLSTSIDWSTALKGIDVVIHLAARVHQMQDQSVDPLAAYRSVNRDATLFLAHASAQAGVRRFIFLSSIKVNGEGGEQAYSAASVPEPKDPYGLSKWEAEQGLWDIQRATGMEVTILRPPLIYGPGVGANFKRLVKLAGLGLPLPFGSIKNARSFLAVGNLVHVLSLCIDHSNAANQTFLLSDGSPCSTPELLREIGRAFQTTPRLTPCPVILLEWLGKLTGQSKAIDRLTGSLIVDSSETEKRLDWTPACSMSQELLRMKALES